MNADASTNCCCWQRSAFPSPLGTTSVHKSSGTQYFSDCPQRRELVEPILARAGLPWPNVSMKIGFHRSRSSWPKLGPATQDHVARLFLVSFSLLRIFVPRDMQDVESTTPTESRANSDAANAADDRADPTPCAGKGKQRVRLCTRGRGTVEVVAGDPGGTAGEPRRGRDHGRTSAAAGRTGVEFCPRCYLSLL